MSNLQKDLGTSKKTDTKDITANSDKVTDNLSKADANSFGVYETKQVVREIEASSERQTEQLNELSPEQKENLENKTGSEITDDHQLKQAVAKTNDSLTDNYQRNFRSKDDESMLQADSNLKSPKETTDEDQSLVDRTKGAANWTQDTSARELIEPYMPADQVEELQEIIGQDLGEFNQCPNLLGMLDSVGSTSRLAELLKKMFGILGRFDLKGIIDCLKNVTDQLSTTDRQDLLNELVDQGALNSYNDLTRVSKSNGDTVDQYDSLRRLGRNRKVQRDPVTKQPNNTWRNPEVKATSDETFARMNAEPDKVYTAQTMNSTKNESVLDQVDEPVYNVAEIQNTDPSNGFTHYSLGDKEKLLRNVPPKNKLAA